MVKVAEDEAVLQPAASSSTRAVASGSYKVNGDDGAAICDCSGPDLVGHEAAARLTPPPLPQCRCGRNR
jgi:hypothetical protein